MMFYRYDLDGFTYVGDDQEVVDGADPADGDDLDAQLKSAGWEMMLQHGRDTDGMLDVYKHKDGSKRGLFVDIKDISNMAYACLVSYRAWPQYYRTELVPIMRARDSEDIAFQIARLANLVTAIAKYGLETPVDWLDGKSQLDAAADDALWRKRIAATALGKRGTSK